ncbi:alpha/beta hydrolase family protein [Streptomyces sp. 372A]|uniref:alpha/beta hydrolase n=1 Tax=Streptomyces sp. SAS_281 TaxID=3412744 RepID=UPI00403C8E12
MPNSNRVLLLSYDLQEGRVVLARNDPDRARAVVVMVPGVGSGLSEMERLQDQTESLFRKVASGPDDDTVSVITWIDYVAPQSPREAADPAYAVAGARRLASFLVTLPLSRPRSGPASGAARVTVVAHGYGGLVAGLAARDHGLRADALVLLASTGTGVGHVGELRYTGPVFATSQAVGGDGTAAGLHGAPPDSPGFGATVLRAGPLSHKGDPVTPYVPELRRIIAGQS